jgi:hypothetical protein
VAVHECGLIKNLDGTRSASGLTVVVLDRRAYCTKEHPTARGQWARVGRHGAYAWHGGHGWYGGRHGRWGGWYGGWWGGLGYGYWPSYSYYYPSYVYDPGYVYYPSYPAYGISVYTGPVFTW